MFSQAVESSMNLEVLGIISLFLSLSIYLWTAKILAYTYCFNLCTYFCVCFVCFFFESFCVHFCEVQIPIGIKILDFFSECVCGGAEIDRYLLLWANTLSSLHQLLSPKWSLVSASGFLYFATTEFDDYCWLWINDCLCLSFDCL